MKRLLPFLCLLMAASGCHPDSAAPTGAADITSRKDLGPPGIPNQGIHVARLPATTTISRVRFSLDGQRVYISYWNDDFSTAPDFVRLRVFNVTTGAQEWFSTEQDALPWAFSPDGKFMFTNDDRGRDGKVTLRRAKDGQFVRTFLDPEMPITHLAVTPDGTRLLTADHIGRLLLWDVDSGKLLKTFGGDGPITTLLMFHDGRQALTTLKVNRRQAKVWLLATGQADQSFEFPVEYRMTHAVMPDGKFFIVETSGEDDYRIARAVKYRLALWDLAAGKVVRTFAERPGDASLEASSRFARQFTFLKGGQQLLTGDTDNVLRLWDVASGELLNSWEHRQYEALSPDGQLAVATEGRIGVLYQATTRDRLRTFDCPEVRR